MEGLKRHTVSEPRPPLGVMPKESWIRHRLMELARAVKEYTDFSYHFPVDQGKHKPIPRWLDEMKELLERLDE